MERTELCTFFTESHSRLNGETRKFLYFPICPYSPGSTVLRLTRRRGRGGGGGGGGGGGRRKEGSIQISILENSGLLTRDAINHTHTHTRTHEIKSDPNRAECVIAIVKASRDESFPIYFDRNGFARSVCADKFALIQDKGAHFRKWF